MPKSFDNNFKYHFFLLQNTVCNSQQTYKFKSLFCTQKPVLNAGFKDFLYRKKINETYQIWHEE